MKAVLIDDEKNCTLSLAKDLEKNCPEVEIIGQFNNSQEGLSFLQENKIDLLFLDIEMPRLNGFELLEELGEVNFKVIFTTAYDEFAVKAFRMSAVDYLLKPIDRHELKEAVEKAEENQESNLMSEDHLQLLLNNIKQEAKADRIAIPTKEGYEFIDSNLIVYCEADSNYTTIFLSNKKKFVISKPLKEIENILSGNQFIRIHHSFVVNLDHVTKYVKGDGGYVVLNTQKSLSVSRAKKNELIQRIKRR